MADFIGWRAYSLKITATEMHLRGVHDEWDSAVKSAVCLSGGPFADCPVDQPITVSTAPKTVATTISNGWYQTIYSYWGDTHNCGIHSFKTAEGLWGEFGKYDEYPVVAECLNYGRVEEYEKGYRSEHTRILRMFLLGEGQDDLIEAHRRILETRFGVPVTAIKRADFLKEYVPEYKEPDGQVLTINGSGVVHGTYYWTIGNSAWQTSGNISSGTMWKSQKDSPSGSRTQRRSKSQSTYQSQSEVDEFGKAIRSKVKKIPVSAQIAPKKNWWLTH